MEENPTRASPSYIPRSLRNMVKVVRTEYPQRSGLIAINLAAIIFGTAALYGRLDIAPLTIFLNDRGM